MNKIRLQVEAAVTRLLPPQTRTGSIPSYGSSASVHITANFRLEE